MSKMYAVHFYNDMSHGDWYVDIANSWDEAYSEGVRAAEEIDLYVNYKYLHPDADVWEIKENCPMSQYEMERELQERPYTFVEDWCVTNL